MLAAANQPTLLLVAQPYSYRIAPYLAAAKKMGLAVIIASKGAFSLVSEVQQGLHIDPDEPEKAIEIILAQAKKTFFVGVLATDDSTIELAAKVAKSLALPHNPPQAALITRRKDLARRMLKEHNCAIPHFQLVDLQQPLADQIQSVKFPCVVKPVHLSASRGVIRANTPDELLKACKRSAKIIASVTASFESTHLLIEDYIDGEEIAFEGYLKAGKLYPLMLFDKPDPLTGPFFEETIYISPSRLNQRQQQRVIDNIRCACQAYGLTSGPIHAELRVNQQDAWILEVANRTIGGDCARTLDNGNHYSLEALSIALACNLPIDHTPPQTARGVMMLPIEKAGILRRVEGIKAATEIKYITKVDILIQPGNELVPLPEGNQYLGYIFAEAPAAKDALHAIRQAWNQLNIVVAEKFTIEWE